MKTLSKVKLDIIINKSNEIYDRVLSNKDYIKNKRFKTKETGLILYKEIVKKVSLDSGISKEDYSWKAIEKRCFKINLKKIKKDI